MVEKENFSTLLIIAESKEELMVTRVRTVSFRGIEAIPVDVQIMVSPGKVGMHIVGLPDKTVAESRERVQAALHASGLSLPPKKIIINLAPADLPKEGSHYDLPIALGLMVSLGIIPANALAKYFVIGELSLDGTITHVAGALPAAIAANTHKSMLICPESSGAEAAWASAEMEILAPSSLIAIANHFRGLQTLPIPVPIVCEDNHFTYDFAEIIGQETAKRAMEVTAAGGHNLLMCGPPGAGKSMLAQRLPSILPPLSPRELLEISMIASIAGTLSSGKLTNKRPFRSPHHSATMAAMVGGGNKARPGEASLAHNGILFLDELPEFSAQVLDSLRQLLESGECIIARANYSINYPARIQLIAAMNPCRCASINPNQACVRGARCKTEYQARISGALMDRIDIKIDVPPVLAHDLHKKGTSETSKAIAKRVSLARDIQIQRFYSLGMQTITTNAQCPASLIEEISQTDTEGKTLLQNVSEKFNFSARAYHRILRVARTLADLDQSSIVRPIHLSEAISWRLPKTINVGHHTSNKDIPYF